MGKKKKKGPSQRWRRESTAKMCLYANVCARASLQVFGSLGCGQWGRTVTIQTDGKRLDTAQKGHGITAPHVSLSLSHTHIHKKPFHMFSSIRWPTLEFLKIPPGKCHTARYNLFVSGPTAKLKRRGVTDI